MSKNLYQLHPQGQKKIYVDDSANYSICPNQNQQG